MLDLSGKIALITGATRGIGQSIAEEFAKAGCQVIGTATTLEGANTISDRLAPYSLGKGYTLDVSCFESIQGFMEVLAKEVGAPHILINNAGITRDNLLLRMKPEEWNAVIQTDLSAVYYLSKACLKGMLKYQWGRIISLSSVVGVTGNAGQTNYAAAKAGLIGFSKSLAQEIGSRGITVNVVAPGYIETDMTARLDETQRQALLQKIPLKRIGTAQDIAKAVLFLASNQAEYITGETLHVNGGMYMD